MKESNNKGVANYVGPESWGGAREGDAQALTGVHAGQAIELRKTSPSARVEDIWSADLFRDEGRQHWRGRFREAPSSSTRSENQGTYGNTAHGNREIPRSSAAGKKGREADRIRKSKDSSR